MVQRSTAKSQIKSSTWLPSAEITGPIRPSNRYGEGLDTKLHARLEAAANKLLAKAGFFVEIDADDREILVEAESCGTHGLRPTWHGRA